MMTSEKRENFNKLITWLADYCWDHNIGVVYSKEVDHRAKSKGYNNPSDLVVINGNWLPETEIPFIFAHEIGHVIENTPFFNKLSYLGSNKAEYSANVFAIRLLQQYCLENEIEYDTIYDFAKAFGIPKDKWYILADL